ncbi:MAG: DUF4394 domain-containing protein [Proteobacteria bacterium]|nr:DUF4394 domain-containing protein [Pseudomonadota bacterium]
MKTRMLAAAGLLAISAHAANALELVALTDQNELIRFESASPQKTWMVAILGTAAKVIGIDVRPTDGKLYGLDAGGNIYRIDVVGGRTEKVSTLSVPLETADSAIVDFNPQADRMRVIGPNGQSLRVNVETGAAIVDGRLAYVAGDASAGKKPGVTAGAYINSVPGAKQTQLFEFDSTSGAYVIQDPPNDGVLASIGEPGLPPGTRIDAMDIYTDKDMKNYTGVAIAAGRLWEFSVTSGKMREIGPIAAGRRKLLDIAVVSPP